MNNYQLTINNEIKRSVKYEATIVNNNIVNCYLLIVN